MKKQILCFAALLISLQLLSPSTGFGIEKVLRIEDRKVISFKQMIEEIRNTDVILVGENHNSKANHEAQLEIIKALFASGTPFSIGLEMFSATRQSELDRWISGATPVANFITEYYQNWSIPWPLYRDIFLHARAQHIPMVGLNIPQRISTKVFKTGFSSLTPAEKKEIPPGITCTLDKEYRQFIDDMYEVHDRSGKSFDNFCETQMLWDSAMAWHIINYLNTHPGRKMVVLTGVGHSWKRGIPHQIKTRSHYRSLSILPDLPNGKSAKDITISDADYLLLK
jgi:uncharacterized iron-regulated protein